MMLLEDHSLDIPLYLLRNRDGTFQYPMPASPDSKAVVVTAPVTPQGFTRKRSEHLTDHDRAVIKQLQAQEKLIGKEKAADTRQRKKAERDEKAEKAEAARQAGRKNFMQHFKWGFEI